MLSTAIDEFNRDALFYGLGSPRFDSGTWATTVTCVFELVRVGAQCCIRPARLSPELFPPLKCSRQLFWFLPITPTVG